MARLPAASWRRGAGAILLALTVAGILSAQPNNLTAADNAVKGLKEVTSELSATVTDLRKRLDEAIARRDRGYRLPDGRHIEGADADLSAGEAGVIQAAVRKFIAFRMLAARDDSYQPAAAADMDRIQELIAESRRRVEASSAVLRRLLVVSVNDINRNDDAQVKARHERLLKARTEAQEAAKLAFFALPVDLPETGSPEESSQKAWDLQLAGKPMAANKAAPQPVSTQPAKRPERYTLVLERRKRFTLVREASVRMALTDAGTDDEKGRHLFYQEEWIQRGPNVIWMRWRVAVEPSTGQHILIKRYTPIEFPGFLDDRYRAQVHNLWSMEPVDDSMEPSRDALEAAMADVTRSSMAIRAAVQDYHNAIREALGRDDRMREAANELTLDGGLSAPIRESLFAIRGHMAGVRAIVELERKVKSAIEQGRRSVEMLEPLAAWGNHAGPERVTKMPAADWERLLDQSDREIDSLRNAEAEAHAVLPPDASGAEAKFPALARNLVVRLRTLPSRDSVNTGGHARYLQEVWRRETTMRGSSEVRRTVTLMLIDPNTGVQTRAASNTKYYPIDPGGLLEEVFEEYASQELIVTGASYQK